MAFDQDERRKQALMQALERGRQYAAASGVDHAESARLTHQHVDGLAAVLLPHVRSALRGEVTAGALATELVSDAHTVATWLLRTGAIDSDALENADKPKLSAETLLGGVARLKELLGFESAKADEVAPTARRAAAQVESRLVASLEARLKDQACHEVDDEEVAEHSSDLSRLLISNWFGVLEDAVEAQPDKSVKLEYRAFPPSVSAGVVTEGSEGFALPSEQAISKVFEYQESLAMPGQWVMLSPIVSLYRSKSGPWHAFHTKRAEVLAALQSEGIPARSRLKGAVARASEAFSPLAIGRAMQFQGRLSMNTALVHQCSYVAANIVRRQLHAGVIQLDSMGFAGWIESPEVATSAITRQMAQAILDDLEALAPTPSLLWWKRMPQVRRAVSFALDDEESSILGDAYMLALPATAVLLAGEGSAEAVALGGESTFDFECQPGIEPRLLKTTVAIVSSAMAEASAQSDQQALGRKIRTMMMPGHEPSGFDLLACG